MKITLMSGIVAAAIVGTATYMSTSTTTGSKSTEGTKSVNTIVTTSSNQSTSNSLIKAVVNKSYVKAKLTSKNSVTLFDEVNGYTVNQTIKALSNLDSSEKYLILDSPGGSVFDGARLLSYIEENGVNTVCVGMCASMAAHIHAHGKVRYMVDRSVLMFHNASGGVQGTLPQMISTLSFIGRFVQKLDNYVISRSKWTAEEFTAKMHRDLYIDAEDSIEAGLADKLLSIEVGKDNIDFLSSGRRTRLFTPKQPGGNTYVAPIDVTM
jgi:ATP-dependent Clp protease protease subunit